MKTKMEREEAVVGLGGGDEIEIEIERAKQRCRLLIDRIRALSSSSCSSLSSSSSCNRTLLRLAQSELSFLSRLPILPNLNLNSRSLNIGHLEAVVHILQQPFVKGVSRVCKPIPLRPLPCSSSSSSNLLNKNSKIHVDIVCSLNGNPVWFLVSARNPNYIFWNNNNYYYNASSCANNNNRNTNTNNFKKKKKKKKTFFLRTRIQQLLDAASHSPPSTKPCSIILFFSNGLDDTIRSKLEHEFGASSDLGFHLPHFHLSEELEGGGGGGDWIYPPPPPPPLPPSPCVLQIKVDLSRDRDRDPIPKIECGGLKDSLLLLSAAATATATPTREDCIPFNLATSFFSLISRMKLGCLDVNVNDAEFAPQKDLSLQADLINFDTTALIALISGISNGSTHNILAKSESELRKRFKSNYEFVIAQVMSEIQNPIHVELGGVLSRKRGMICESVCSEFKELVSMCGGANEKSRADHLLKCLMVVGDSPSARMMSLPTTRKLAYKNKVVFGTGDQWRAPTLTANMAFVRAISQTGMSLFTIEHRPRALTGE
ncbi:hypothetical protein LOK49_LG14G00006 [Camellia lanceoleosa]|uniref:Uncharacterized protein n=1 Tax=Camellia lanceoleosa TaxID=1840588 RepID=A0ACC0F8G4_9ERIC|nr:hypothetical protein LOK49_LG14G00006 [Camellia lanceoleosa]